MANNFDRSKYKDTFEKRFGSGSYESGLTNAREIGRTKVQADFEKAEYNRRVKEAQKAVDKQKKEQEKKKEKAQKKVDEDKELYDLLEQTKKSNEAKKGDGFSPKKVIKPIKNLLSDFKGKSDSVATFGANVSNKVAGGGLWKNTILPMMEAFDDPDKKPTEIWKDMLSGDLNKDNKVKYKLPKNKSKAANVTADLLGYGLGGIGVGGVLKGTKLGAKGIDDLIGVGKPFTKKAVKKIAKETSKEGAAIGAIMSGTEIASREIGRPSDYNWKQNLSQFGLETGAGAVLDPLATLGVGKLLSKVKKPPVGGKGTPAQSKSMFDDVDPIKEEDLPFTFKKDPKVQPQQKKPDWDKITREVTGKDIGSIPTDSVTPPVNQAAASLKVQPQPKKPDWNKIMSALNLENGGKIPKDPINPAVNEVAATIQSKPRPDLDILKKSYEGKNVGGLFDSPVSQVEKIGSMNSSQSTKEIPKNPYESVLDSPMRHPGEGKPEKFNRNQKYIDLTDKAIANSDLWKDKNPLFYGRETLERNFEGMAGKEDAQFLKDSYVQPVREKEAERIRFVNKQRETVKNFGIKAQSIDDQLTQMYGEGKINLDNLKRETPNWEKVVKTSEWYRQNYDQLINTVNKVLDDAGEKTIPFREDYFPHYQEVEGIFATLKKAGFNVENNSLPTDINGLTQNYKPNKKWFGNAMQRKSDETTFGAIAGFDKYIEGVSQLIYHTDNIKRLRGLENGIRNKHEGTTQLTNLAPYLQEQGNLMAGKKASIDRVIEEKVGRVIYNGLDTIKRRTGLNMLGYSVGSATSAFIPLTQAAATTNTKAFTKGMIDTVTNLVRKDGFAGKSDFLTRRIGSKPLMRNAMDKISDNSMAMMEMIDRFSSQTIVRGKYYELLEKGVPEKEALKQADDWAGRIITDRSKGQQPTLFSSKSLGPLMQFQVEVNNQLSFIFKDIPKNAKNKAQLMNQMTQVFVYSYLANEVYEQILGRRPAFDPAGVAQEAYRNFSNPELKGKEATERFLEDAAGQLPFTSFATGGRYPITSAVPSFNIKDYTRNKTTAAEELWKPLKYIAPPTGGGQLGKIYDGAKTLAKEGVYTKKGDLSYPVERNSENILKGLLLGKSSLPETREHYDKPFSQRKALGEKQTAKYEEARARGLGKEFYDLTLSNRKQNAEEKKMNKAKKELKNIKNDETLSEKERKKKMQDVLKLLDLK